MALDAAIQAYVRNIESVEDFLSKWDDIKDNVTPEGLLKEENGISLLWWVAAAVHNGKPDPFNEIWQKFEDHITRDHLILQAKSGKHKGKSALQLIAHGIEIACPYPFFNLWDKFEGVFLLQDLQPILNILVEYRIDEVIDYILSQIPGHIPVFSKDPSLLNRISARNALFTHLSNDAHEDVLFSLAQGAQNNGYMNAFYDLGQHLKAKENDRWREAFEKVPEKSRHYQAVRELLTAPAATRMSW